MFSNTHALKRQNVYGVLKKTLYYTLYYFTQTILTAYSLISRYPFFKSF